MSLHLRTSELESSQFSFCCSLSLYNPRPPTRRSKSSPSSCLSSRGSIFNTKIRSGAVAVPEDGSACCGKGWLSPVVRAWFYQHSKYVPNSHLSRRGGGFQEVTCLCPEPHHGRVCLFTNESLLSVPSHRLGREGSFPPECLEPGL